MDDFHPPDAYHPHSDANREYVALWLDDLLLGGNTEDRQHIVGQILILLNRYSDENPYQPTWVTTWEAFESLAQGEADNPSRWLEIVGAYKVGFPRWVVVLCYTAGEAGDLVRPTQLDAGWFPHHFPSPPQAPVETGGHPMDLGAPTGDPRLLSEFIHQQIEHPVKHLTDMIGRVTELSPSPLGIQRTAHHDLLSREYTVAGWMPNPL